METAKVADLSLLKAHEDAIVVAAMQKRRGEDVTVRIPELVPFPKTTEVPANKTGTGAFPLDNLEALENDAILRTRLNKMYIADKIDNGFTVFTDDEYDTDIVPPKPDWTGVQIFLDSTFTTPAFGEGGIDWADAMRAFHNPVVRPVAERIAQNLDDVSTGSSVAVGKIVGSTEGKGWSSLTVQQKAFAKQLGFNEDRWNKDKPVASSGLKWNEMRAPDREAWEALGWNETSWTNA